ncbi:MAG: alpha/beta hydrolase [Cyanobacteria bacterium SZAS LIN-2]|nr:alpha/beta hydrolase [Cyanobacteria bacterium SZAS LIN-2]
MQVEAGSGKQFRPGVLKPALYVVGAVAALFVLSLLGLYLYCAPRFNKTITAAVLFHPPAPRKADEPVVLSGVTGRRFLIPLDLPVDGAPPSASPAASGPSGYLDSLYFKTGRPELGVVLLTAGVGGSVNVLADPFKIGVLLDNGYSVLVYDHEGYGLSSGVCDIDRIVPDAVAAYDFLVHRLHYLPTAVIGYGQSFGGGVTSELSKVRNLKAIILESTFTSPKQWADDHSIFSRLYPDFLFIQPAFDNVSMLNSEHPPVLLIVSGLDQTMPPAYGREMDRVGKLKRYRLTFNSTILPASYHARVAPADRPLFKQALEAFLKR